MLLFTKVSLRRSFSEPGVKVKWEKNRLQQSLQLVTLAHLGASHYVRCPVKPGARASIWDELIAARQAWERIDQNESAGAENLHSFQKKEPSKKKTKKKTSGIISLSVQLIRPNSSRSEACEGPVSKIKSPFFLLTGGRNWDHVGRKGIQWPSRKLNTDRTNFTLKLLLEVCRKWRLQR